MLAGRLLQLLQVVKHVGIRIVLRHEVDLLEPVDESLKLAVLHLVLLDWLAVADDGTIALNYLFVQPSKEYPVSFPNLVVLVFKVEGEHITKDAGNMLDEIVGFRDVLHRLVLQIHLDAWHGQWVPLFGGPGHLNLWHRHPIIALLLELFL